MFNRLFHHWLLKRFKAPRRAHTRHPTDLGLNATEKTLQTPHGPLFAWWIEYPQPSINRPVAIVLHGWGANASDMLDMAPYLQTLGCHILLFDARCHGNSADADFTSMPRFAEDLEAARAWVLSQQHTLQSPLVAVGHSVGAAAVLLSASRTQWAAVVSMSAFAHPADMMWRFLREHRLNFPGLGDWILKHVQQTIGFQFDDIAPQSTIQKIACPVLLVHGAQDQDVPLAEAQKLSACSPEHCELIVVQGVGHDLRPAIATLAPSVGEFIQVNIFQNEFAPNRMFQSDLG